MAHVDALLVQTDSDCPSADAVQAEVRELTTPEQRRSVPSGAAARISDRGESIAITLTRDGKTTLRVYRDAARDCARRAHFVSVLVVVSLIPPDPGSDVEPAPEPEPEPEPAPTPLQPKPTPARSPIVERAPRRVRIELAGRVEASTPISDSARVAAWGGTLGGALGAERLRFTLGVGYVPRARLDYTGAVAGRAELERLEAALGVRLALSRSALDTSFDAGLVLSRDAVTGRSAHEPAQAAAFSAGARFGVRASWSEQRALSPFLAAHTSLFPFAPALAQLPQGTVGHLPYVWIGLSAGLALAL